MKLETVMNAMVFARDRFCGINGDKRIRQYRKFRDWIIRRDARMMMEQQIATVRAEYWKAACKLESNYNDKED